MASRIKAWLGSLQSLLLQWMLVVAVLPVILLMFGIMWHTERLLIAEKSLYLHSVATEKAMYIRQQITQIQKVAEGTAAVASAQALLMESQSNAALVARFDTYARRLIEQYQHYDVLLVNTQGKVVYSVLHESDFLSNVTSPAWQPLAIGQSFDQVKGLMSTVVTPYRWYEPSKRKASFVSSPVFNDEGRWVGVVMIQLGDEWLFKVTRSRLGLGDSGEVVLAQRDENQAVIAVAPLRFDAMAHITGRRLDEKNGIPANLAIDGSDGAGQGIDYRQQPVLAGWVHVPALELGLVIKQDMAELLKPMQMQRQWLMLVVGVVLLLIVLMLFIATRRFVHPIRAISHQVDMLAKGHWRSRLESESVSGYELQLLTQGINTMTDTIERQIDQLEEQTVELEEQSSELKVYSQELETLVAKRTAELEALSVIDPLTGLYNRRHLMNESGNVWRQALRHQQVLAFMMLDIDFFKQYNDELGHQKGDDALQQVASAMKSVCRRSGDFVFRMGGEEMALLASFNQESDAVQFAEQLRERVLNLNIRHPHSVHGEVLTVSIGLAIFDARACDMTTVENIDALYSLADKALYMAKTTGRNRVVQSPTYSHCGN